MPPTFSGRSFRDRREAGRLLAGALAGLGGRSDLLVLAIPRGGVPVGYEVAAALGAPLDIMLVRKLGHPEQPELAMGAIASGGIRILNREIAGSVPAEVLEWVTRTETAELERRELAYRGGRAPADPAGRTVVLVDDGLATGSSLRAAITALRRRRPAGVVVAVPVAPAAARAALAPLVDRFVCLIEPELFVAVGEWYEDFEATSDGEVRTLLALAAGRKANARPRPSGPGGQGRPTLGQAPPGRLM